MNREEYFKAKEEEVALILKYREFISPSNIGLDINPGWLKIVREIFEYCDANKYPIQVVQIKEKFGDLRFYYDTDSDDYNEEHEEWISNKERESGRTCMWCGAPGEHRPGGWIKVTCDEHVNSTWPRDGDWSEVPHLPSNFRNELKIERYNDLYSRYRNINWKYSEALKEIEELRSLVAFHEKE